MNGRLDAYRAEGRAEQNTEIELSDESTFLRHVSSLRD